MALHYDVNQTPTSGSVAIVQLVTVLSSANWTVHAYGDGSSRITGALPNSTEMGNSSSWVAMKAPSGNHTISFQRGTSNTLWWVAYTWGGLQTNGTGLVVDSPITASQTKEVFNNNGSARVPGTLFPADNVSGAFRFNVVADDASPYNWYAAAWDPSTGNARTLIFFDGATVNSNDPARYVLCANYRGSAPWAAARDWLCNVPGGPIRTWYAKGLGSEAWALAGMMMYYSIDGTGVSPRNCSVGPFDSNDDLLPGIYATLNSYLFQVKGVGTLFLLCSTSRATGDIFDITGETDDRVCIGDFAFPWPHGVAALV
jgi:hypothetical protein